MVDVDFITLCCAEIIFGSLNIKKIGLRIKKESN